MGGPLPPSQQQLWPSHDVAWGLSIMLSLPWIAGGGLAFLGWARVNHSWPFAPVQIREAYLDLQEGVPDSASADAPA
ncbi:MAG TPA: hypothetical protein VIJ82_12145 [Streptosporangiaceae bacterium]|jgi:hypothetical protein